MINVYYMPRNFISNNYRYTVNNYYYTVRTNQNCYTQYSTTYCDCYDIYYTNSYLTTTAYQCNYNTTTNISVNNFTDNYFYRYDISQIMTIFFIIVVICYFMAIKPIQRLMGRWLKL